ncbi:MAG: hypothetical protein V4525_04280 [Pseudomonadota bacterium]
MENISYSYFDAQSDTLPTTTNNKDASSFMPVSWVGILAGVSIGVIIQLLLNRLGIGFGIDTFHTLLNNINTINIDNALWWGTSIFVSLAAGAWIITHFEINPTAQSRLSKNVFFNKNNKEKDVCIAYSISKRGVRGKNDYKYVCSANKKYTSYLQY